MAPAGLFKIEVILPIDVEMRIPCGPDMGKITLMHGIALLLELLHDSCHIDSVPHDHRICDEIEATGLMGQDLPSRVVQVTLVGNDEGRAKVVEGRAFVELPQNAAPILGVRIPAHDMQGAREPSILLEGHGPVRFAGDRPGAFEPAEKPSPSPVSRTQRPARSHPTNRASDAD